MHPTALSLPHLSLADAAEVVGEGVYAVTPLGQGLRSRVYRVETDEGLVRVVRLVPRGTGRIEREAWVRSRLGRHPDAPVLAEIHVTDASIAQTADVVSMAELPGTTLFAASRSLFEPDVRTLYARFGAGMAAIHGVTVAGYGLIGAGGHGPYASWHDALRASRDSALEEARVAGFEDLVPAAREALDARIAAVDEVPASLLHGDAQPMNVQVHRGRLVAFLDFEFASGGDPAYELAYLEPLFEPSHAATVSADDLRARRDAFYEGYARNRAIPAADASRTALYRLLHALRGTEFLSVVGPQLAAPVRAHETHAARAQVERWIRGD